MKKNSPTKRQPVKTAQKKENNQSHFSLFGAKTGFTNEPLWYKLAVIIIIVIAMLAIVYFLKEWALPAIGQQVLRSGITNVISGFRNRAP